MLNSCLPRVMRRTARFAALPVLTRGASIISLIDCSCITRDSTDGSALGALLTKIKPDEIYSLSAQSHVRTSFDIPEYTADSITMGTLRLLEAARAHCPEARIYNASSSEMFGSTPAPQMRTHGFTHAVHTVVQKFLPITFA